VQFVGALAFPSHNLSRLRYPSQSLRRHCDQL
jgi:hypothetical protein